MSYNTFSPIAFISTSACLLFAGIASAATIIYSEDFNGNSATNLNGTTPSVTTNGATWVAANHFKTDGSITATSSSATLSFTPASNFIYTLDASVSGISGSTSWIGLGFANGQSIGTTNNDRFIQGNVIGSAWMLVRGSTITGINLNQTLLNGNNDTIIMASPFGDVSPGGDIDMRIVLNTSGVISADWTATWYAKRPSDVDYTFLSTSAASLTTPISSVGFAVSSSGVSGTLQSFLLTSTPIPEPTTPAILAASLGVLALFRRRPASI